MFRSIASAATSAALAALLLLSPPQALAQDGRATLTGIVTDPQAAAIGDALVTVTADSTGLTASTRTDAGGWYRLPLLLPDTYRIVVRSPGFTTAESVGLALRAGETRRADVALVISGVVSSVTVGAPITDSGSGTLATVLPFERVQSLPLNGRQLQELTLTAPGVAAAGGFRSSAFNQFGLATSTDGNAGAFSVNGARSRSNGFFLDGADINIPEQGVIAFPPLVEAIREVEIQTNGFKAEYGRYAGSIINYVTRSGSNMWQGSTYGYFRDDALDADDFFTRQNDLPSAALSTQQIGAAFGGPLQRNRHFVFGNYEYNRVNQGTGPFASNVPTADQRAGLLGFSGFTDLDGNGRFDAGEPTSPATIDLAGRLSPISQAVLDGFIPLPNVDVAGANFIANDVQTMREHAFAIRTDSRLSDRDLFTARYNYDFQDQFFPFDIFFVSASLPAFPFSNPERRQSLAMTHTRSWSAFTSELRFGLNRQSNPIINLTTTDPASIGLPNGSPQNEFGRGLPIIRITGFGGTGGQPFTDNLGASTTTRTLFQIGNTWRLQRGAHGIAFGGEVRHARVDSSAYRPIRGSLTFNGSRNGLIDPAVPGNAAPAALADFLLGLPSQASISSADPTRRFRTSAVSAFVQDDWQVNTRLSVNAGLRYEIDTPLTEADGLLSNYLPGLGNFVVGSPELPRLHDIDMNNIGPRFGVAYRLDAEGRTVVRGGAGLYFDNGVFQDRFGTARTNAPFASTAVTTTPTPFPDGGSAATTLTELLGAGQATSAASIDVDYRTPQSAQYNASVQRQLSAALALEVGYVGRRGSNQSRPVNINQVLAANSPAATSAGIAVGARPFADPTLPAGARFTNDVVQQQFNGRSTYHALQARLERRWSAGASFLLAYTWSQSRDDASGIGTGADDRPQDSFNLDGHWARSNYDVPHRFVGSASWELPFGAGRRFVTEGLAGLILSDWRADGILTWQSGQPFTVTVGSFDPVLQISNRRPDQVGDPMANVPDGFAFNPAAFAAPAAGQLGSTSRNSLRGDDYFNVDLAVSRRFRAGGSRAVQARVEVFNLFNSVNFNFPVATLSSAAFGRYVSNATAPRIVQVGLRLEF